MVNQTLQNLLHLESPWKWNQSWALVTDKNFVTRQTEKCNNIEEESAFQWTTFNLHILLTYECLEKLKDVKEATKHITYCEEHLEFLTKNNCKEPLFLSIKNAMRHVTFATKAVLLHLSDQPQELVQQMMMRAEAIELTTDRDLAGVLGIKAGVCIQYGTPGHHLAMEFARTAVKLDPYQAEWHFLLGNCLGRIRRVQGDLGAREEEMAEIEKANDLEKNASYIVHLAQLYAEHSSQLHFDGKRQRRKIYALKAEKCFKEAIALRPNCSSLIARVAHNLLRIRDKQALDVPYVKTLLDRVVEMAPNNVMVYHDLGIYHEKFENNIGQAIFYLNKAHELHNQRAFLHMIVLKWKQGVKIEIIMEDVKLALQVYTEEDQKAELLALLGACHLLEGNMDEALKYFNESVFINPTYMQKCRCFSATSTNLIKLLRKEIESQRIPSNNAMVFLQRTKDLELDSAEFQQSEILQGPSLQEWKSSALCKMRGKRPHKKNKRVSNSNQ